MQGRLEQYPWMPAHFQGIAGKPKRDRRGIVIHSGSFGPNIAGWIQHPYNRKTGKYRRGHYHLSWNPLLRDFVQTELMHLKSEHAGRPWNDVAYSIGLPGPWHMSSRIDHIQQIYDAVGTIVEYDPGIEWYTCHEWIAPARKFDPGPGFDLTCLRDFGFRRGRMVKIGFLKGYRFFIYRTPAK